MIRDEQPLAFADGANFIERGQGQILETLKKAIAQYDEQERMSLQIIAPMYKGKVGIDAINATMQAMINPNDGKKRQVKAGTVWFREDDKVMLLKNLPEDDVYNGDIGYICEIHDGIITVDFGSQIVDFSKDFLYYLSHAYCISVHKAQGSEYDRVYCVVEPQTAHMLNKRLLYTAVSRAKKGVVRRRGSGAFWPEGAPQAKPYSNDDSSAADPGGDEVKMDLPNRKNPDTISLV